MFNFMSRFIPNLSEVSAPLRLLLANDAVWEWPAMQHAALDRLKLLATDTPCMSFFDARRPTVISADAGSYGLGAVLLQNHDGSLVQLRTTSTEQQYAQIEKECLAVVRACERFHGFVYGDPSLTVHTDHKPLIPLINTRDLNRVPLRCQRLLMRLMKYNPAAVYIPGKQLVVADALSRAPDASVDTPMSQLAKEIFLHISTITSEIVSVRKAEELAANTAADTVLLQVLQ